MDRYIYPSFAMSMDVIKSMGLGLDILFRTKCPEVFQNQSVITSCFTGEEYLAALKTVAFNGSYGEINFDENGDNIGHYLIKQFSAYGDSDGKVVGFWHQDIDGVVLDERSINWTMFDIEDPRDVDDIPDSVCSYPCPDRMYYIVKEMHCCWDCRECRNNEKLIDNRTACETCPENYWPEDETALECVAIAPAFMDPQGSIGITLLSLAAVGVVATIVVACLVIKYRNKKMMKASSRELMAVILVGIFLAFVTVFMIIAKPTIVTCAASKCGFAVSIAMVYAPLLVKTNRVYRIFNAGAKGKMRPMFISARVQLFFAIVVIIIQASCMKHGIILFTGPVNIKYRANLPHTVTRLLRLMSLL